MTQSKTAIATVMLALMLSSLSPAISSAQVFNGDTYKAESAIISAGSRAAAVYRIKSVPSVGIINLAFRNTARFRSDVPDVSEYRISSEKHYAGISKLRSALRANPVTRAAVAQHGVSVNRVVGVDIYSNGSLRFYTL